MNRAPVVFLLIALITISTISCVPVVNTKQLANIEAQLQTLASSLASTKQELASTKQALAEAQVQTKLFQEQARIATDGNGVATGLATNTAASPTVPTVLSFTATPSTITIGQASNLQWNVTGADTVYINPGIGNVSYAGTQGIYPTTSTTYILTATNRYGSVTAYATVTILEVYPSPSSPYYSGYPYNTPGYTSPPRYPFPPPYHPPSTNNSTRPRPPFPR